MILSDVTDKFERLTVKQGIGWSIVLLVILWSGYMLTEVGERSAKREDRLLTYLEQFDKTAIGEVKTGQVEIRKNQGQILEIVGQALEILKADRARSDRLIKDLNELKTVLGEFATVPPAKKRR